MAGVPSLSALLPAHSHDTLRGFVPAHTHEASGDAEAARCASIPSAVHADELACGAEEIASFGAALPPPAPASIVPVAATFATRVTGPLAPRALTIEVTTPPPRG